MKLSIIVPMYNVEKYIQRCLSSIINNKGFLENCELIVVNDGTKDNSESIARKIIEGLPNTQIIVQENQGLSAARNTGLSRAIGEYVWFIDSDDWIEPDAIKSLMNEIDKEYDVIQFGYNNVYSGGQMEQVFRTPTIDSGGRVLESMTWPMGAQFSLYRREFLYDNNLIFYKGIYHEDNDFTPRVLSYAKEVSILSQPLYNYFKGNPNSILSTPNIKKCHDLILVSKRKLDFLHTVSDSKIKDALLNLAASELNTSLRNIARHQYSESQKEEYLKDIDNDYIRHFYSCSKFKYVFMACCLTISVRYYIKLLNFL